MTLRTPIPAITGSFQIIPDLAAVAAPAAAPAASPAAAPVSPDRLRRYTRSLAKLDAASDKIQAILDELQEIQKQNETEKAMEEVPEDLNRRPVCIIYKQYQTVFHFISCLFVWAC